MADKPPTVDVAVDDSRTRTAVVVGAGPVGCLAALALTGLGWKVKLFDGRPDPTRDPNTGSATTLRSINLAISARGLAALKAIHASAAGHFTTEAIPMRGRMIHSYHGEPTSQAYDPQNGQCINSIDRNLFNQSLLSEVRSAGTIEVYFQHKLTTADFDRKLLTFRDSQSNRDVTVHSDFCIGADGSYSNVRRQMMRVVRMNFQQEYISHEYIELRMPPAEDEAGNKTFAMDPNHLHIWPRHSFMLIALPNKDLSFTCTLFAPASDFTNHLGDSSRAVEWFREQFPDALPLIGEAALLEVFRSNPRSPLIAIKAAPYHYKDRVVILGDAAHSMVPFFGQGLNCGLEDVRVLSALLREAGVRPALDGADVKPPQNRRTTSGTVLLASESEGGAIIDVRLASALQVYSDSRHEDLVAISDMAMGNYVEMRHSVATPSYIFRRAIDGLFSTFTAGSQLAPAEALQLLPRVPFPTYSPGGWLPLYAMVTFRPDISYSTARRKAAKQSIVVSAVGWIGVGVSVALLSTRVLRRLRYIN